MQIIIVNSKYGSIYYDASTLKIWAQVATKLLRRSYRMANWPKPSEEPVWLGPDEGGRNLIRDLSEDAYATVESKYKDFCHKWSEWADYQSFYEKLSKVIDEEKLETTMTKTKKPLAWALLVEGERFGCYDEKIEITRVEGPESIN